MSSPELGLDVESLPTVLSELHQHLKELFCTHLGDFSMQVMQEKFEVLQKSSYYLIVYQEEMVAPNRLQQAMKMSHTQVSLLLSLMSMVYEEICLCRQDLQLFLLHQDKAAEDVNMVKAALDTVIKLHEHLQDFNTGDTRNLGYLNLDKVLIPCSGDQFRPPISALLIYKWPVVFDQELCWATATTVYLSWSVHIAKTPAPMQMYEVQCNMIQASEGGPGHCELYSALGPSITLEHLTPNRLYHFAVKRLDTYNLVYSTWMDTIQLQTWSM